MYSAQHAEENHDEFKEQCLSAAGSTFAFDQPPMGIHPKEFVETHFGANSMAKDLQFRKGTTTCAFVYEPKTENDLGGVVIAVDSRASAGEYISSQNVMKILHIADHLVATMAGGAADCQFWTRVVAKYCKLFELREKVPITVRAASKYMVSTLYAYRGSGLSCVSSIDSFILFSYLCCFLVQYGCWCGQAWTGSFPSRLEWHTNSVAYLLGRFGIAKCIWNH